MRSGSETASISTVSDPHLGMIRRVLPRTLNGCEECLLLGREWVHLRPCLNCGVLGVMETTLAFRARSAGHPVEDRQLDPVLRRRQCR